MKAGDEITCKFCNTQSFLVKKPNMNGWKKIGDLLTCSNCGKIIEEIGLEDNIKEVKEIQVKDEMLKKLASFLGEKKIENKTIIDEEKRFCKDCRHFIKHPFSNKCGLFSQEVNPMDDCNSYIKK